MLKLLFYVFLTKLKDFFWIFRRLFDVVFVVTIVGTAVHGSSCANISAVTSHFLNPEIKKLYLAC